jgi:hypothetical protein
VAPFEPGGRGYRRTTLMLLALVVFPAVADPELTELEFALVMTLAAIVVALPMALSFVAAIGARPYQALVARINKRKLKSTG